MLQGKDRYAAIAGKSLIERYLAAREDKVRTGLAEPVSAATKSALTTIMTSRDEAVLITGSDLSGHREVMRELGKILPENEDTGLRGFRLRLKGSSNFVNTSSSLQISISIWIRWNKGYRKGKQLKPERVMGCRKRVTDGAENVIRLQQAARYVGAR